LLLYICSENADVSKPDHAVTRASVKPVKTKTGLRIFPPDLPRVWDVGVRIGAALRRARTVDEANETAGGSHQRPRPHVRRAHWHTYRIGPKRAGTTLKWLPPIAVNIDDPDALPAVIRPVT
jgi:hypothetical protein